MAGFYRCYVEHDFRGPVLRTIRQANEIIDEMREQGYVLTLRQLFYQFVRRNWLPNTEQQYKRLGRIVTDAREAGIMDWLAIEDRGRNYYGPSPEEEPSEVLSGIEDGLLYDRWARQDTYLEVWVEKQALESIIARPCDRMHVIYMACKGFLSASEAWRAGLRFREAHLSGKRPILLHLADHDPSGMDMTRDNSKRLRIFAETHNVEVRRIALNMDQVAEHNPPPNPAKASDSRSPKYVERFGESSWELDALPPGTIEQLIEDTVGDFIDWDKWDETIAEEREARKPLAALSEHWHKVEKFLHEEGLVE